MPSTFCPFTARILSSPPIYRMLKLLHGVRHRLKIHDFHLGCSFWLIHTSASVSSPSHCCLHHHPEYWYITAFCHCSFFILYNKQPNEHSNLIKTAQNWICYMSRSLEHHLDGLVSQQLVSLCFLFAVPLAVICSSYHEAFSIYMACVLAEVPHTSLLCTDNSFVIRFSLGFLCSSWCQSVLLGLRCVEHWVLPYKTTAQWNLHCELRMQRSFSGLFCFSALFSPLTQCCDAPPGSVLWLIGTSRTGVVCCLFSWTEKEDAPSRCKGWRTENRTGERMGKSFLWQCSESPPPQQAQVRYSRVSCSFLWHCISFITLIDLDVQ